MSESQSDVFAEIAAQRQNIKKDLCEPAPHPRPTRPLPLQAEPDPRARFTPAQHTNTPEALRDELQRLREVVAPFLNDLAPDMPTTRDRIDLNTFSWRVETDEDKQDFMSVLAGDGQWETIQIPHYGGPLGRVATYYRTTFDVSDAMRARGRLFVCFRGVDYIAHVFLNGALLGSHEGFFAPFEFDCTTHARPGTNTLLVKVENDAICMGNDSWGDEKGLEGDKIYAATGPGYDDPVVGWHHCPPGMGIYQDVRIEARAHSFISDLFVRPLPERDMAEAWVELWNCGVHRTPARLQLSVYGQNFEATVIEDRSAPLPGPLGPRSNVYRFKLQLPGHRTWSPDTPWLYQLQAKLFSEDDRLLDAACRQFGMRSFRMDTTNEPRGRMVLNGNEIRLRGANTMGFEQQDVMKKDWKQLVDDILLAKLCNMNFWRLTQRPVQEEVYDYCDRLGLMTQTDLPLFAKMRRSQFAEGVRQAGEMERLVRSHPCNIMVTYINEPFDANGIAAWRHLTREELERFFTACDQAVLLANPDRVIKAVDGDYDPPGPGLPDNHCYCCWYNGHGLDVGKLHRGYWQRVKPGWMYGCGEFGTEGLENADLMRRRYPAHWLPQTSDEEREWSPTRIVKAQTGNFHTMWFDTQHSLEDWVSASQQHQAWATRIMTEAFRRDHRMNTFAIHLFIDAFPSGWMKSIMDVERRPKAAYFEYREALTPLMVNLRTDRCAFSSGETTAIEAWICNDTHERPADTCLVYRVEMDGRLVAGGWTPVTVPICSTSCEGVLTFELPDVQERTTAKVRLALLSADNKPLHDTMLELDVFPRMASADKTIEIAVLGRPDGVAATLAGDFGVRPAAWQPGPPSCNTILIDDLATASTQETELQSAVQNGTTVVILGIEPGEHTFLGQPITCNKCGMNPVHFASRKTGHPLVDGFKPNDFKFWYDAALGYPSPLLASNFEAVGWSPVLTSGAGKWKSDWTTALAAAEKADGHGCWRLTTLALAGRIEGNPVARIFAQRLITNIHHTSSTHDLT